MMNKIVFFFLILLCSPFLFSQENDAEDTLLSREEYLRQFGHDPKVGNSEESEQAQETTPVSPIDIPTMMNKIQSDPKEAFEMIERIKKEGRELPPEVEAHFEQLKALILGQKGMRRNEALIRETLSVVRDVSNEEIKRTLSEKLKLHPLGQKLSKNVTIMNFIVEFVKDPHALPKIASIADQQERLRIFVGLNLLTLVFSFFWRRRAIRRSKGFLHALFRFVTLNVFRVWFMLYYFSEEFGPTILLFKKYFL